MICSQYFFTSPTGLPPPLCPLHKNGISYNFIFRQTHMQANVDNLTFNRCLFSSKLHSSKQLILWWLHGSEHLLYS